MAGVVSKVTVTLNGIQHNFGRDIDVLLVSPDGRAFIPFSDIGQANGFFTAATITLTDSGATLLPSTLGAIASGTYKPTNHPDGPEVDTFLSPAPGAPYNSAAPTGSATFASVFNGAEPNGMWTLYVMDDSTNNGGSIGGGWCLDLTTGPPQAGQLQFGLSAYDGNAGDPVSVTVTRTGGSAGAASVNYSTSNGSATGGASCGKGIDYVSASGTLNFASGETSKTFTVQLCPDSAAEPTETVNLTLSNPSSGAALGSPSAVVLTINPSAAPARQFCNPLAIEIASDGRSAGGGRALSLKHQCHRYERSRPDRECDAEQHPASVWGGY